MTTPTAIPAGGPTRVREYGVPVRALIGRLRALDGDFDQLTRDYELPPEVVEVALAYYRCNKEYTDARLLLLNSS